MIGSKWKRSSRKKTYYSAFAGLSPSPEKSIGKEWRGGVAKGPEIVPGWVRGSRGSSERGRIASAQLTRKELCSRKPGQPTFYPVGLFKTLQEREGNWGDRSAH